MREGVKQRQLKQNIEDAQYTIKRIKEISSTLHYHGKQRINQTALFQVQIKHTNEFTIKLGYDYLVQLRAQDAIKLLQYRIENYKQELTKIVKVYEEIKPSIQPKVEEKKISQQIINSKSSYVECIGQQNGQSIFNIVEVEGEDDQIIELHQDVNNKNKNQVVEIQSIVDKVQVSSNALVKNSQIQFDESKIVVNKEKQKNLDGQSDSQIDQDEKLDTFSSEEQQLNDDQDQYDDIMLSHRAKLGIHPQLDQKQLNSLKNTVEQNQINKVQQQKKNKPEEKIQKETKGEKKMMEQIEEILPPKISRFKLEMMKKKLEKQL